MRAVDVGVIRPITFLQFSSVVGSADLRSCVNPANCSWFASRDGRVAGCIVLDAGTESFHSSVYRLDGRCWYEHSYDGISSYSDAETALVAAMRLPPTAVIIIRKATAGIRSGEGRRSKK